MPGTVGTAAKIAAAAKKTISKPGVVKSGAATAVKNEAKKAITYAKNTVSMSSRKSRAEELDAARRRLEERLGKKPAQGYENYRTKERFESGVQIRRENGVDVFYWGNERIISQYEDGVHVFFNTVRE